MYASEKKCLHSRFRLHNKIMKWPQLINGGSIGHLDDGVFLQL